MATGGPAAALPATAAAVAARAVAVAFLALPLQRPLPTRVGLRLFPPIAYPPKSTPILLKPLFYIALAAAHETHAFFAISTGRRSPG